MLRDELTMRKIITNYFKTVNPEQLKVDLEKAHYSVLKNVKSYTLEPMFIKQCDFEFDYEPVNENIIMTDKLKHYRNFYKLSSHNNNYDYDLAA